MPSDNEMMTAIKALDPSASLAYETTNGRWHIHSRVEIGGDGTLTSILESAPTTWEAIRAFWDRITTLPADRHLVVDAYRPTRREYRWNGGAFALQGFYAHGLRAEHCAGDGA